MVDGNQVKTNGAGDADGVLVPGIDPSDWPITRWTHGLDHGLGLGIGGLGLDWIGLEFDFAELGLGFAINDWIGDFAGLGFAINDFAIS
jgi:hypothetical protein